VTLSADVVVVGGGNAALCAALAAREAGARVLVLERAPREARGGNSAFTGGAFRVAYDGIDDLMKIMPDLSKEEREGSDFGTYTEEKFLDDLGVLSGYRVDPDLADEFVKSSLDTILWMRGHGVRFIPIFGRQAFKVDGKYRFWGGLTVEVSGGGLGLMESLYAAAERRGIEVAYGAQVVRLIRDGDRVTGVEYRKAGATHVAEAGAVILASGGFHANAEWRAKCLGANWDLARVRGSRYNTGDGIRIAIDAGAMSWGNWSGCHSVFYDMNAPQFGDINMLNQQKNYFSLGIVVNAEGKRFVDEGADFRNYTYSNMGRRLLAQTNAIAWQVFDQKAAPLLPDEYRVRWTTKVEAATLEELAQKLEGVDPQGFLATVREFNAAVMAERPFNPAAKDGRGTRGLAVDKSNWANALDSPPYVAFGVTCGITCTYGGIRIDTRSRVLDCEEKPIPGLYAAGELVGGLYYVNYPGGAGLMSGAVFGRIAGRDAAKGIPS
jgi:tricarballylate dehydrogenase